VHNTLACIENKSDREVSSLYAVHKALNEMKQSHTVPFNKIIYFFEIEYEMECDEVLVPWDLVLCVS
jgi:hypothetical protein